MKRLLISLSALLFLAFFNEGFAQAKTKPAKAKTMAMGNPHYAIGKAAYAKMVRELWKDFDDNNFDRHDYIADTVVMMFPDGEVSKGKEANMEGVKKYRGSLGSVKSTIFACIPLTNLDEHEDAVCIWGQEEDTTPDGKVEKKDIHEVWWFNKAGKVTRVRQWTAKFGE
jgi:hypothetical protein